MATLTVRGLDDQTHALLRLRAARHGRSMEAEVRAVLHDLLVDRPDGRGLGSRIHARFAIPGGVELDLPERRDAPRPAALDE